MAITSQTYNGDGSTTVFTFTVPYIDAADVKARVDNVATTAFSVSGTSVTFTTAPPSGTNNIKIFRDTNNASIEANFQSGEGLDYYKDLTVHQLSRDERKGKSSKRIRSYKFFNCFPSNVSSVDLDYGNNDAIEEFTVEFQVQFSKAINEND